MKLSVGPKLIETRAIIDTGAESYAVIDTSFAEHHVFLFHPVAKPMTLHGRSGHENGHFPNHNFAA
jgi:predicted aspartyl protease